MSLTILFLIGLVALWIYRRFVVNKNYFALMKFIPAPPGHLIFGNSLDILKTEGGLLQWMCETQKKYGRVFCAWVGSSALVLLSDPKDVEILLSSTTQIDKSVNYKFILPWLGTGLVTSTGKKWHKQRKIITPAFHFNILESFVSTFNSNGKILIENLQKYADGRTIDIHPFIKLYALDNIYEAAMGLKIDAQIKSDSEYVHAVKSMLNIVTLRSYNALLRCPIIFPFTKEGREQKRALNILHTTTYQILYQRKKESIQTPVINNSSDEDIKGRKNTFAFLDILLQAARDGVNLSDEEIREEIDTFMFAGHDTLSSAISFVIFNLAIYQDVQEKVYSEQEALFESNDAMPTYRDLQDMKYLEQVIKEVERLFPSVPLYSRLLNEDLKINGYTLPAKCSVSVFAYMLHRNPDIFPDPEKFDPERFSLENSRGRHAYAYVPFSAGLRNCIGQKFAMLEIKATLSDIIRHFKILPVITDSGDIFKPQLVSKVVLTSSNGLKIRLLPRKQN